MVDVVIARERAPGMLDAGRRASPGVRVGYIDLRVEGVHDTFARLRETSDHLVGSNQVRCADLIVSSEHPPRQSDALIGDGELLVVRYLPVSGFTSG